MTQIKITSRHDELGDVTTSNWKGNPYSLRSYSYYSHSIQMLNPWEA